MDPDLALLLAAPALLAVNALFAAAEAALIALHTRAAPYPRTEEPGAPRTPPAPARAEELAVVAQLGRSAASLLLGYLLAVALHDRIAPVALAAVLLGVVLLHAVIGEQLPRVLASRRAERAARLALGPLRLLSLLLAPLAWPLSRLVPRVLRLFGWTARGLHPLAYTAEEIRMLVARSSEQGVMEDDEREMIQGVFEISRTVAREVMTPRTEVVAVPADVTLDALVAVVVEEGHSRLPVYEGSIDNVVGVVLTKDLFPLLWRREMRLSGEFDVRALMREAHFVPDTKPVDDLLAEFRQRSVHLAIVLDEFGGTYGVVTLEDLLEEIVGEIHDEYDVAALEFAPTPEGDVLIDGGTAISEVNERLGTALPEENFDTIGGYVFGALERVPVVGDMVQAPSAEGEVELHVEETDERRVAVVRLTRASGVGSSSS